MFQKLGNTNMNITHGDFMFYIADIFATTITHGTITEMCQGI